MEFTRRRALAALATSTLAGCLGLREDRPAGEDLGIGVDPVLTGLDTPWDLAFRGEEAFLSERPGRVSRVDLDGGERETLFEPGVRERGEGGLLGLAIHPEDPDLLYAYYTTTGENRVVRYDLGESTGPGSEPEPEPIVEGIPAARIHNGGRIAFGPEGDLWVLAGDADDTDLAGDPASMAGSVLRVTPEGEPSDANPGFDEPRCYTVGHRNPQGIDWLADGTPVVAEHGPRARDEISRLVPGEDYGWPAARDGEEYPGTDYARPLVNTGPDETWAPSGMSVFEGVDADGDSEGRLLVGGLRSRQLVVVDLYGPDDDPPEEGSRYVEDWMDGAYTAVARRTLQDGLGRIRHVGRAPDGALYAITSNRDGRARGGFPRDEDDVLVRLEWP